MEMMKEIINLLFVCYFLSQFPVSAAMFEWLSAKIFWIMASTKKYIDSNLTRGVKDCWFNFQWAIASVSRVNLGKEQAVCNVSTRGSSKIQLAYCPSDYFLWDIDGL